MKFFLKYRVDRLPDDHFASTGTTCPICKETPEEAAEAADTLHNNDDDGSPASSPVIKIAQCGHIYHTQCLTSWLENIPAHEPGTCPLDREELYPNAAPLPDVDATPTAPMPIPAPASPVDTFERSIAGMQERMRDLGRRGHGPRANIRNDEYREDDLGDFEAQVRDGAITNVVVDCWTRGRVVITYTHRGEARRLWMRSEFAVREPYILRLMWDWERQNPEAESLNLPEERRDEDGIWDME